MKNTSKYSAQTCFLSSKVHFLIILFYIEKMSEKENIGDQFSVLYISIIIWLNERMREKG